MRTNEYAGTELLSQNRKQGLAYFEHLLQSAGITDAERIVQAALDGIKQNPEGALQKIQDQWYSALRHGTPDYSVYEPDLYLAEVWMCWFVFPRQYLREMQKPATLPPDGILGSLQGANTIVDLGNGIGATSAALQQIFPSARVIGTNVANSAQMKIGELLADQYGFTMVENVHQIAEPVDLVFASEYFEHFEKPLDHLAEIVEAIKPARWLIANTFGADSIGHFDEYNVSGVLVHGSQMGRVWGKAMRLHGYVKVKTKMWNNRPAYYVKPNAIVFDTVRRLNQEKRMQ